MSRNVAEEFVREALTLDQAQLVHVPTTSQEPRQRRVLDVVSEVERDTDVTPEAGVEADAMPTFAHQGTPNEKSFRQVGKYVDDNSIGQCHERVPIESHVSSIYNMVSADFRDGIYKRGKASVV